MRCVALTCVATAFLAAGQAASAGEAARAPHLVYVARQAPGGDMEEGRNVACDLTRMCDITINVGHRDLDRVTLRVFAEDGGGASIIPIGRDRDGRMAVARRVDVAWGPHRSLTVAVHAGAIRVEEDEDQPFTNAVMGREPVATFLVAVKELARPAGLAVSGLH